LFQNSDLGYQGKVDHHCCKALWLGYLGLKVFNKLPNYLKEESDNPKKFKQILKDYLSIKTFHSLQEYFEQ